MITKVTITVVTEYEDPFAYFSQDGDGAELSSLVRDAEQGDAYIESATVEHVDEGSLSEGARDFFSVGLEG